MVIKYGIMLCGLNPHPVELVPQAAKSRDLAALVVGCINLNKANTNVDNFFFGFYKKVIPYIYPFLRQIICLTSVSHLSHILFYKIIIVSH